jgi:hypothetical protein
MRQLNFTAIPFDKKVFPLGVSHWFEFRFRRFFFSIGCFPFGAGSRIHPHGFAVAQQEKMAVVDPPRYRWQRLRDGFEIAFEILVVGQFLLLSLCHCTSKGSGQ